MSSIVIARDLSYEFLNGRGLFKNLNFALDTKLAALVGPNGVGKTCLANLIAGTLEPTEGAIRRMGSVKLFPQRQEPPRVTVIEFLSAAYEWSLPGERLLEGIDRHAICATLSGGQWMRVRLARALNDQYLILDEPTNDLDRDGRRTVIQFLQDHEGGALLISHDRECLRVCEEIFEVSNRGLAKFGDGWSGYVEAKEREGERMSAALERAKRGRESALADRAVQQARQEKRSRRGAESVAAGGIPKILLGARKRRAQAACGKLDPSGARCPQRNEDRAGDVRGSDRPRDRGAETGRRSNRVQHSPSELALRGRSRLQLARQRARRIARSERLWKINAPQRSAWPSV
jgi:ATPase subunit of ABC transporter with duplicated ATPase domains